MSANVVIRYINVCVTPTFSHSFTGLPLLPLQYLRTAFSYFSQSLGASNVLSCVNRTVFRTVYSLRLTDIAVALCRCSSKLAPVECDQRISSTNPRDPTV